jgi:hypothetical protein
MKENKSGIASLTAPNLFIQLPSLIAVTLFRIAFGIVWLVDGAIKFVWLQPSDVISWFKMLARVNQRGFILGITSGHLL